jgi:hypothetical protein
MAREMGFKPAALIRNIPSPSQRWKAPVRLWIRELYLKRQEKIEAKRKRSGAAGSAPLLAQARAEGAGDRDGAAQSAQAAAPRPGPEDPETRRGTEETVSFDADQERDEEDFRNSRRLAADWSDEDVPF